ncbi:MAG: DEAD/DEAH box helicase [Sphaerochaetaceae bacterium]
MKFEELGLHADVLEGVANAGFTDCTKVQERVCPIGLAGKDIMARSKTGSGKTAVFVLTILERMARAREEGKTVKAMIISPTRELALQIAGDARLLSSGMDGVRVGCFYGGVGYDKQKQELSEGVDIYVGTPGRLIDFMRSKEIDFKSIDSFVVDEADRMFDMGFYPDIKRIFAALPEKTSRQTMMFSATLSTKVRDLAWNYMNDPEEIELEPEEITVNEIVQELYHVSKADKFKLLLLLLKRENPSAVLIFTNTKYMAVNVSERLKLNGYKAACLMGDMPQSKRQKALDQMKSGAVWGLIATDVAARGLQIDDLPLVVNYDIPEDYENYVHRIGRTARAGKKGKSITFADEEYVWGLEPIENYIHMRIPVMWADGLDEVHDLSEGKRIRNKERLAGVTHDTRKMRGPRGARDSRTARDFRGRKDSKEREDHRGSSGQRVHGTQRDAGKLYQRRTRRGFADDSRLAKLSESERLAIYRKEFFDNDEGQEMVAREDARQNVMKPSGRDSGKRSRRSDGRKPGTASRASSPRGSSSDKLRQNRPERGSAPKGRQGAKAGPSPKGIQGKQSQGFQGTQGSQKPAQGGIRGLFHRLFGKTGNGK